MPNMRVKMADLNIRLRFRNPELAYLFAAYRAGPGPWDMDVRTSGRAIADIIRRAEAAPSPRYAEFLALSEAVSEQLPQYGGVLVHAACLGVDGRAYLFLAPSGTGKTTHMKLWMDLLGPRAAVINGDKPFLRLREGTVYAYGNPWAGKENLHANMCVPLGAMLFLERGPVDALMHIPPAEALTRLVRQVYMPRSEVALDQTLSIIGEIAGTVPAYLMRCTMRETAARVATEGVLPSRREAAR